MRRQSILICSESKSLTAFGNENLVSLIHVLSSNVILFRRLHR